MMLERLAHGYILRSLWTTLPPLSTLVVSHCWWQRLPHTANGTVVL